MACRYGIYFWKFHSFLFHMESYLVQHRQLLSILSKLIYHLMSLDYGKLYVEGNTAFSTGDFCTCQCTLFNTLKAIFNAGWKVSTKVILSSWCFGSFLRRLFLSIKFTFWISGGMISALYPLSINHDSKSNSFRCKSTSFEQNQFIRMACRYGIYLL